MKALLVILLVIALVVVGPIATILSINTLFGTMIPVNIFTWLSALWLGMVISARSKGAK